MVSLLTALQEEAQRKLQELKEQKEHEQYLEMKKAFVVEEEGQDVEDNSEQVKQPTCIIYNVHLV